MTAGAAPDGLVTHVCFHGVGRPRRELEVGEAPYWLQTAPFLRILDELEGRADVELSFDDGNVSDVDVVLPALVERGLTATFFVLAGRLESAGSLSPAAVRELRSGGRAMGRPRMQHGAGGKRDGATQGEEFQRAREVLQDVSEGRVDDAALPLGRYDRRSLSRLRQLGYARLLSSDRLRASPSDWFQPRFSVRDGDDERSVRSFFLRTTGLRLASRRAVLLAKRLR